MKKYYTLRFCYNSTPMKWIEIKEEFKTRSQAVKTKKVLKDQTPEAKWQIMKITIEIVG